jgi:hypothetical protein
LSDAHRSPDRPLSGHDRPEPVRPADVPVVIYGAKSSEDDRGSIPTQVADCTSAIDREGGRELAGTFTDEDASAFTGNRGPGLAAALELAARLADDRGEAELWVQHSDRLARGDGRKDGARHLGGLYFETRARGIRLRSVQDDDNLADAIRAVLIGERNFEDSRRKSLATRDGLSRRKESGKPVGAVPLGYVPRVVLDDDLQPLTDSKGRLVTERVVDDHEAAVVRRLLTMLVAGHNPGEVARALNAAGDRTKRGRLWTANAVRDVAGCRVYVGEGGYPELAARELWDAAQDALAARQRPAAGKRHGLGGRYPRESYLLRGIVHCRECGESLYCMHRAVGRVYVCANRRRVTGGCDAEPIRADVLEASVLTRLRSFVGDIEEWIGGRLAAHNEHLERLRAAAERQRDELARIERRLDKASSRYDAALDDDDADRAAAVEGEITRLHRQIDDRRSELESAEAIVEEWRETPDVDEVQRWMREVFDVALGRIERAESADQVAAALRAALEEVRAAIGGDELVVDVSVRAAGVPDVTIFTDANRPPAGLLLAALQGNAPDALPPGRPT